MPEKKPKLTTEDMQQLNLRIEPHAVVIFIPNLAIKNEEIEKMKMACYVITGKMAEIGLKDSEYHFRPIKYGPDAMEKGEIWLEYKPNIGMIDVLGGTNYLRDKLKNVTQEEIDKFMKVLDKQMAAQQKATEKEHDGLISKIHKYSKGKGFDTSEMRAFDDVLEHAEKAGGLEKMDNSTLKTIEGIGKKLSEKGSVFDSQDSDQFLEQLNDLIENLDKKVSKQKELDKANYFNRRLI